MDNVLPSAIASELDARCRSTARSAGTFRVVVGEQSHPVVELNDKGFVIVAEGRPPLRGFADVFRGSERVLHGLVTCAWARDGQVGYDFKRDALGQHVPADYVLPEHAGLLESS